MTRRLQNIPKIFQRKVPEWDQRVRNGVSVLRMTSAYRERRQRIENGVGVLGIWDLVLSLCQIALS